MGVIAPDGAPPEPVTAFLDATVGPHGPAHWLWTYGRPARLTRQAAPEREEEF